SLNALQVSNSGTIEIAATGTGTATLSGDQVTNHQLTVDSGATLTLSGTTLSGGTITDNDLIDVTGSSKINGTAALNGGQVTVESATLTLDNVTVDATAITGETATGSIVAIEGTDKLTLQDGASLNAL